MGSCDIRIQRIGIIPRISRTFVISAITGALDYAEPSLHCEVSVVLCDDVFIQDLNRRYRDIDAPTDVLAFSMREGEISSPQADDTILLGDIVISLETARRQAREAGHAISDEIRLLLVHGILHLLGHDDEEPHARKKMFALQAKIVEHLAGSKIARARTRSTRNS